jgi:hypothetical protein
MSPLGAYLLRTAERGLLDAAKVLLFVANYSTRGCGNEPLRHAHLHQQQAKTPAHCAGV